MIIELYQIAEMRKWSGFTVPYKLFGVKNIAKADDVTFSIKIHDTKTFFIDCFEYVKDIESGKVFVEHGKWVDDGK